MIFLDEDHQTVVYKLSDRSAKIRNIIDVSDDFFELTIEDAKSILRDARKAQKEADPEGKKTLMTKGKFFVFFFTFYFIPFGFGVKGSLDLLGFLLDKNLFCFLTGFYQCFP